MAVLASNATVGHLRACADGGVTTKSGGTRTAVIEKEGRFSTEAGGAGVAGGAFDGAVVAKTKQGVASIAAKGGVSAK